MRRRLTSAGIKAATVGDVLWDESVPGLHLRMLRTKATYYLYYRTKSGTERRPALGSHSVVPLAKARSIARDMLGEVAAGHDPAMERSEARSAPTVAELCARYIDEYARERKKSWQEDERMAAKYIAPGLGMLKVQAIRHEDIQQLHQRMRGAPYQANRVLALLSRMFTLAEVWGLRPHGSNPCAGVRAYQERKRKRYMTATEAPVIAALLRKYADSRPASVLFLYLLILSGARKGDIANARWEYLDGSKLELPDSKTGGKTIYLPPQAMAVLEKLPRTSGTLTGIKDPRALWERIRREAGCPDLRMHDLRHSFASAALAAGLNLSQIGELLGHGSTQTTQRYAHLIDDAAQAAAGAAADYIERMMAGRPCSPG